VLASERAASEFFLSTIDEGIHFVLRELPLSTRPRTFVPEAEGATLMHVFQLSRALHVNPRHGHGMRTRTVCYYAKG
jgi:hypothetical protein